MDYNIDCISLFLAVMSYLDSLSSVETSTTALYPASINQNYADTLEPMASTASEMQIECLRDAKLFESPCLAGFGSRDGTSEPRNIKVGKFAQSYLPSRRMIDRDLSLILIDFD